MECPHCRSTQVRFSSNSLTHFYRRLKGSRRRYCVSCRKKWVLPGGDSGQDSLRAVPLFLLVGVMASFILVALLGFSADPVRWMKSKVKGHYEEKYGGEATNRLWQDLGKFYEGLGSARSEYGSH